MKKRHDAEARRRILKRWRRSGLSSHAFARQAGVSFATLYRWRRELEPEAGEKFIELVGRDAAKHGRIDAGELASALEIALPAGIVIRVGCGADEALVRVVVQALL